MAFATPEQVHRYPRRFTLIFEVLCTALVLVAVINWGRSILQYLWDTRGRDNIALFNSRAFVRLLQWLDDDGGRPLFRELKDLTPSFIWLVLALFAVLFIRNFFPIIRTSGRGLLIEWGNSWVPIGWEQITGLRVTEDLAGERFVLLLQTDRKALTGWHRFYSFLYRLGFRRGVIITSAISNFLPLAQTLQTELEQVARQTSKQPVRLDEKASSPFFQLLLSPAGFFSRRSKSDKEYVQQAEVAARTAQPGLVTTLMATYPKRINSLLVGATAFLALWGLLRALNIILRWIAAAFTDYNKLAFFEYKPLPASVHVWWLPFAAILLLIFLLPMLIVIRNLLPDVETRPQGLMVRYFNRWLLVPWGEITAVKSADLTKDNHVVIIQTTNKALRWSHRVSSLLFDGSNSRGVLLTSALSTFEPLLQQIVLEVSRGKRNSESEEGILVEDAPAWLLRLLFKPSEAIDRLVASNKSDDTTKLTYRGIINAAAPMVWLAAIPTVMLLTAQLINSGLALSPNRIITAIVFFIFCLLEWPLAAGVAQVVEQNLDDDAHRARPFYLYPIVQLPRLLVMVGALILLLLGVPLFPALLWLGAAVWSFLLTAGLWEGLYGWSGAKLLTMGAIPSIVQVVMLLVWGGLS
jgi:hypothetical protein